MSTITRDDWLAALNDVGVSQPTDNPDAMTVKAFGALFGLKRTAAKERIRLLVEAGKATRVSKRETDASGRSICVPAYVLQKPARKR